MNKESEAGNEVRPPDGAGDSRNRRKWTQRRGAARRTQLIEAAVALLHTRELDEFSLELVARQAGIPLTSIYHFYPDKLALMMAVTGHYNEQLAGVLAKPYRLTSDSTWEDLWTAIVRRVIRWLKATPGAGRLLISGKMPPEVKLADRTYDRVHGALVESIIARHFELPALTERTTIFYHAVEITDLLLQLSMIRSQRITPRMVNHALIASQAYLREFLPKRLPRKDIQSS
jgi:AcrR family transcriptional regulator